MKESNMTSEEFSTKTGLHPEDVDSYIYGNRMPSIEDLIKIAGALRVSTDYLLDVSRRKRISTEEEMLLQSFERCDDECKQYLIAKAGVLCVEGISAVAAGEYGKYVDPEKKSYPSNGTEG
jgi:transcriptional regulator with XRE-family HTH domain